VTKIRIVKEYEGSSNDPRWEGINRLGIEGDPVGFEESRPVIPAVRVETIFTVGPVE
jgi:hypothetical protein